MICSNKSSKPKEQHKQQVHIWIYVVYHILNYLQKISEFSKQLRRILFQVMLMVCELNRLLES